MFEAIKNTVKSCPLIYLGILFNLLSWIPFPEPIKAILFSIGISASLTGVVLAMIKQSQENFVLGVRYRILKQYLEAAEFDLFDFKELEKITYNTKFNTEFFHKNINKKNLVKLMIARDYTNAVIGAKLDTEVNKYMENLNLNEKLEDLFTEDLK